MKNGSLIKKVPLKKKIKIFSYKSLLLTSRQEIEDATAKLISIKIMKTEWNEAKGWGQIRDIYFKNISLVDSKFVPSEILSYGFEGKFSPWNNPKHTVVENVTFENLVILGKVIMNPSEGGFIVNPYAKNIRFITGQE